MIRFLLKGLWRDKSRSRLPIIVVSIGVMLSVFMHAYVNGVMGDSLEQTARFQMGHVSVMTKAYSDNKAQNPNDLGFLETHTLLQSLESEFSEVDWVPRIRFGGLIDVPNESGETKEQGTAVGFAVDLLNPEKGEAERLNLQSSLVSGKIPQDSNEILLSDLFASKLGVKVGDKVSLITSTVQGSMSISNFKVSGTLKFGMAALDRGSLIADISAIRQVLDMEDGAGEILGFFRSAYYDDAQAAEAVTAFAALHPSDNNDPYYPVMQSLRADSNMALFIDLGNSMAFLISLIFILAMSLVLWNAGLLGGLRRYGEFGVRLAIGEEKIHLYRSLIAESFFVGIAGTISGTAVGLFFAWLLQTNGLNIDVFTKASQSSLMMPGVLRARITPSDFYIGFFPGVLSTLLGAALSGIGIFKRKTASLFKELE